MSQSERDLQLMKEWFSQAPAPKCMLSGPTHKFAFANKALLQIVGRTSDELLGRAVREAFPEIAGQGYFELLDMVYDTGETFVDKERQLKFIRYGKEVMLYMDFSCHPLRDAKGRVEGILFQGSDVTKQVLARTRLEERVNERTAELQKAEAQLRELNAHLVRAQDEERRRLAVELHDTSGQLLVALRWKLESLTKCATHKNEDVIRLAKDSARIADELSKELRTISHLLHPPVLENAGLLPALRQYVEGFGERSGLRVNLDIDPDVGRLSPDMETALLRISQESLTNIIQHANSKTATVKLKQTPEAILLEIGDSGCGIRGLSQTDFKPGVGLQGMRERVQRLNGSFEIQTGATGTTIRVVLQRLDNAQIYKIGSPYAE